MTAKAGEVCEKTADIRCVKCGERVHIQIGQVIPHCPVCHGTEYRLRDRPLPSS